MFPKGLRHQEAFVRDAPHPRLFFSCRWIIIFDQITQTFKAEPYSTEELSHNWQMVQPHSLEMNPKGSRQWGDGHIGLCVSSFSELDGIPVLQSTSVPMFVKVSTRHSMSVYPRGFRTRISLWGFRERFLSLDASCYWSWRFVEGRLHIELYLLMHPFVKRLIVYLLILFTNKQLKHMREVWSYWTLWIWTIYLRWSALKTLPGVLFHIIFEKVGGLMFVTISPS